MTKTEIEFLRNAGFTLAEIMAMVGPMQNNENQVAAAADQPAVSQQSAQIPLPEPTPAPADPQPALAPAAPPSLDNNPEMTRLLTQILAAVQAGNRQKAENPQPEKLSPEEIAGKLY